MIGLVWLQPWWQRRWWLASFIAVALVLIPVWRTQATVFRVTVLATTAEPVLVIQDKGKVLQVNSGNANTAHFTVLPFLQQEGVNQIDWAIATNHNSRSSGWLEILNHLPVKNFYNCDASEKNTNNLTVLNRVEAHRGRYQSLKTGQMVTAGSTEVQLIDAQTPLLKLQIQEQTWLLLDDLEIEAQKQLALNRNFPHAQVLWWSGEELATDLLKAIRVEVAIASSATVDSDTLSRLRKAKIQVFWTGQDGAIQWTPSGKFEATIDAKGNNDFLL